MMIKGKSVRFASSLLALIMILSTIVSVPVYAASNKQALPALSSKKYIQTHTVKTSGRIYAYTDSTLKTLKDKSKKNWWIDCATDECRIVKVTAKAVQVYYPIGNGKWVSQPQWFSRSEFTETDISKAQSVKLTTARINTYWRSDGRISYGSAGKGDQIYILDSSKGNYTQIVYELSSGNWKMGWIKKTDANKYLKDVVNKSANSYSVSQNVKSTLNSVSKFGDALQNSSSKQTSNTMKKISDVLYDGKGSPFILSDGKFGVEYNGGKGRHEGIDFCGMPGNDENTGEPKRLGMKIHAVADGKIIRILKGSERGMTGDLSYVCVYSEQADVTIIYMHLVPLNSLYVGQKIKTGDCLGTECDRHALSVHTHVEIRDGEQKWAAYSMNDLKLDNVNTEANWKKLNYQMA